MELVLDAVVGGLASKVINDTIDISKDKIKNAVKNKEKMHSSMEAQIYNIIVDVLNNISRNKYKNNQDCIYDAAETLLKSFKKNTRNQLANVKDCLKTLNLEADERACKLFQKLLFEEFGKTQYRDLVCSILLLQTCQDKLKKDEVDLKSDQMENVQIKQIKRNRTQEYADKWKENMFLNNFDKRDQNAGVNVKLCDVYIDECLPHYVWRTNEDETFDLKELLSEYIYQDKKAENNMLLILGQPGIGKTTLITWFINKFIEKKDNILVYQFASDLKSVDWEKNDISQEILTILGLSYKDLNGKTLILDGFDEINLGSHSRKKRLNDLYDKLINKTEIKNFFLIITCRENYVQMPEGLRCNYITLQAWNEMQIRSFCKIFQNQAHMNISNNTIKNIIKNKEILGIPLLLYMVLALNISIEKDSSMVEVYDKIFALDGGIYDRCINNSRYAQPHRIEEIKEQLHQISREIAMCMLEENPNEAFIMQCEYQKICIDVMKKSKLDKTDLSEDFKIGNYFKAVRHCEESEVEKLYFIHRSIYEYFVSEYIFSTLNSEIEGQVSKEYLAGRLGELFKGNILSSEILAFLKHKIKKSKVYKNFELINDCFQLMLQNGMTYYIKKSCKNAMQSEMNIFRNILEVLHFWEGDFFKLDDGVFDYIKYNMGDTLNLSKTDFNYKNFKGLNLSNIDFSYAKLRGANLCDTKLEDTCFVGADIRDIQLKGAVLKNAIFAENQLDFLRNTKKNLNGIKIFCAESKKLLNYESEERPMSKSVYKYKRTGRN